MIRLDRGPRRRPTADEALGPASLLGPPPRIFLAATSHLLVFIDAPAVTAADRKDAPAAVPTADLWSAVTLTYRNKDSNPNI